ncbi:hypothetical protein, unlikely [Trypanosoma brucei gambiense DAL972]|uniref:Uncharacterized protein n=1 Tax=Trypanosoma brucei gambiense (strain MHOM/CI/86/DAL972) TaxID=679716 RepID=C9ZKT7_TRYB9|nr:hypothetical protein, unlikely [Trypanosoma brucei gambiense DAL972]CBH09680.1 hypothetical protein, unlikely [Trypanosoma brucei gambiense DAL972]|eukprot:XP_011771973.1 hypothetical protein, unlikely [Trypanosoma brucei gambiense DAL972]
MMRVHMPHVVGAVDCLRCQWNKPRFDAQWTGELCSPEFEIVDFMVKLHPFYSHVVAVIGDARGHLIFTHKPRKFRAKNGRIEIDVSCQVSGINEHTTSVLQLA